MIYANCLFQKGGVNISKKIQFTLILALILFLSINVISANEINDNNLNSIDSSNLIGIDSVEDTNYISSDLTQDQISEDNSNPENNELSNSYDTDVSSLETSSDDSKTSSDNSEDTLDASENSEISLSSGNENNANNLNGSSEAKLANNLQTSKEKTYFTVSKTSILRGSSVYVYLKDSKGNPIAGKNLTLTINNVKHIKTTNGNGAVSLKFNYLLGNYTLKVHFNGDSKHYAKTSSFALDIYQIHTKITVAKKSVARGRYFYAYLKDKHGNPLSGHKIRIRFNGKSFIKTTNAKGRVSLKITPVIGKYPIKISFAGSKAYTKSSRKFDLKVYKRATKITVASNSVIRGKYFYAYLKTSSGKALANKAVTIRFDNIDFHKTTNKNGRVALKIKTKIGTFPTKIIFEGDGHYKASSKSIKLKSYVAKTKITAKKSVVRGKYLYVYLKDNLNKPVSNQKVVITFKGKKYTRTTNSKGRVSLKITAVAKEYAVKVHYAGSNSYKPSTKSFTLHVLPNATAKIIAHNQTCLGEYSIRLTDLNGNPLANQTLKIITSTHNRLAGSLDKITQKTIIIDTDYIYSKATDLKYMKDLAAALRAKGYKVIISGRGPNAHCNDVKGKYSNACVLCLFGGADSGMFKDMSADWYQNLLKKYNNRVVLGFLDPPNTVNLATSTWLKRAHDDDYSPASFTGLSYPGTYLNQHGMDYIYGKSATEMANNFVKYAVNGLSIGLKNTVPSVTNTYTIKTNENGYATISGLPSGTYTVKISYSNAEKGYVADTVQTKIVIK